jgi:hypothetical protein
VWRPVIRRSTTKSAHRRRAATAERSPDQLWAECIAERPDIIDEIVTLVMAERTRLIASPPLAPHDDPKPAVKPPAKPRRGTSVRSRSR